MIIGSTGYCLETCGDGKNYGLNVICEDGNTQSGDGCSKDCMPEKDYWCHNGYPEGKD